LFVCLKKKSQKKQSKKEKTENTFRGCGNCMSVWVRDPKKRGLIRAEPKPEREPESKEKPKPKLKNGARKTFK